MVLTSATIATTTSSSRHHYPLSPSPDSSNSNFSPEPAVIGITLDHKGAKLRLAAMAEQQQPYQEQQQQQQQQLPQQQGSESYVSAHEFTRRRPLTRSVRRSRNPPRNTEGDIYCDHPDCHDSNQIFQRVCEWNKHMDRHERPYKCTEVGCELTQGFTYSGGLLRHQREVHKINLTSRRVQSFFCPFPDCNRSSGVGFSRRENLEEHKRRRHFPGRRRPGDPVSGNSAGGSNPTGSITRLEELAREAGYKLEERDQQASRDTTIVPSNSTPPTTAAATSTTTTTTTTATTDPADQVPIPGDRPTVISNHFQPSSATAATAPSTGITSSSSPSTHLQDASLTAQQQQMQQQQQQQQQQLIHQLREDVGKKEDIVRRQASEILRLHSFMQALPPRLVYGLMQRQQAQGQQQQQQQQQQRVRTQTQTQIQAQALQGSATATATAPRISEVLYTSPTLHTRVQTQSAITPPKQNQMSSQRAVSSAPKADAAEDKQFNIKQDGGD
ncbi:hypothetical protein ABEF93_006563 [Exophiala dermatitidis]